MTGTVGGGILPGRSFERVGTASSPAKIRATRRVPFRNKREGDKKLSQTALDKRVDEEIGRNKESLTIDSKSIRG